LRSLRSRIYVRHDRSTTGGESAGLLAIVNIGEFKALIGFAGQRVIRKPCALPEGFSPVSFLDHTDMIVDRRDMRDRWLPLHVREAVCDDSGAKVAADRASLFDSG
jgi:acetyl-CoA carboxylase beta subunit